METLEQQQSKTIDGESEQKATFTNLHSSRTALFISAHDPSANKRYFLSAGHDGGSITHLITLNNIPPFDGNTTDAEHLNGLVCFTSGGSLFGTNYTFIINPSTHKVFKLPHSPLWTDWKVHTWYIFGFDEIRNQHKILNVRIRKDDDRLVPNAVEIWIFSLSDYSWRKINLELPIDLSTDHCITRGVCVNSVIHIMFLFPLYILAFDLRTEKFSIISIPADVEPNLTYPPLVKTNGRVGVVCRDHEVERNEMHIWMLQDYESRVWVREIVPFPASWTDTDAPFELDSVNMDEIIFSCIKLSRNVISVPMCLSTT
ncbi:F-box protein At1g30790-like [Bidens hawaiensis]|uniref:F-box protein At1g30790-like n=1 Tax=Bidens hawaiensis TaxID=980011 RepID=UPI00404ABE70